MIEKFFTQQRRRDPEGIPFFCISLDLVSLW